MRRATTWLGLFLAVATTPAWAAEGPPEWHVTVTPYVWAAGLYGDVSVGGLTTPVSASFIDILENSDSLIGLQGRLAVSRGPIGVFLDGTYLKLTEDDVGSTGIDATMRMWLLDFGASYRLLEPPPGPAPGTATPGVAVDVYAGGRYTYLEVDLDSRGQPSRNQTVDWIDPIVGARVTWNVTDHFFVVGGGDVGGFGVGSDFAWSALGLFGWRFSMFGQDAAALWGYRALGQDYSTGSGRQRFRWDTTMHGPTIGLSVRF